MKLCSFVSCERERAREREREGERERETQRDSERQRQMAADRLVTILSFMSLYRSRVWMDYINKS